MNTTMKKVNIHSRKLLFILSVQNNIVFDILPHLKISYSCACSPCCNKHLSLNFQCKIIILIFFSFTLRTWSKSQYYFEVSMSFFTCIFEFAHEYLGWLIFLVLTTKHKGIIHLLTCNVQYIVLEINFWVFRQLGNWLYFEDTLHSMKSRISKHT